MPVCLPCVFPHADSREFIQFRTESGKLLYVCDQIAGDFDYRALCGCIHATPAVWLPYYSDARMTQETRRTLYGSNSKVGKDYTQKIDAICALLKEGSEE